MTTLPPGHCANPGMKQPGFTDKTKPRGNRGFARTGAGNETRTRDPDLGKVVLYQLSYSRIGVRNNNRTDAFVKTLRSTFVLKTAAFQTTTAPETTKPRRLNRGLSEPGAGNETRTRDPDLGKVVLYQLSYSRIGVAHCNG